MILRAFRSLVAATLLFALAPLAAQDRPRPSTAVAARPAPGIRLIVLVAVDQFRADYSTRFDRDYNGGLRQLLTRGAVFTNAYLEHYPTVTAVGHSTMLSGATPSVSGIIGNDWFDRDSSTSIESITDHTVTILGGTGVGASPRRMLATTVGDELKMAAPRGDTARIPRVFGISLKDRAAILPAGHGADGAFWLQSPSGPFVSSTYYFTALPPWVTAFNTRPAPPANGLVNSTARILALAGEAVSAERLGQRGVTDVLSVSLSDNDTVGHEFGPDSPQVREVSARTDRQLAEFFAMLEAKVGLARTLIVLTADHGVAPLPEVQAERRLPGGRIDAKMLFPPIRAALEARFGPGTWLLAAAGSSPYLNHALIADKKLDAEEVRRVAAEAARRTPHVMRVYTYDQLQRGEVGRDVVDRRVLRSFNPQRSGDLEIVFEPFWMRAQKGTTHGSPHNYDAHIPLVFMGPGVVPGRYHQHAALNDLAPTVAAMVGVAAPSGADGRVLSEMLAAGRR
jgi:Type I phosphodiesterase / nucleotide pyrophosphatase